MVSLSKIREFDGASLIGLVLQKTDSVKYQFFHAVLETSEILIHSELCETKGGMNLTDDFHQHALDYILLFFLF